MNSHSSQSPTTRERIARIRTLLTGFSLVAALTFLLMSAAVTLAASWTVSTTANSGNGSLRQLIAGASNGDDITFDANILNQTITLSQPIVIDKNITINGPEDGEIIISSQNLTRAFEIKSGANVTISRITIRDGNSNAHAGAILNYGNLTLDAATLINNSARFEGGAIYNRGTLAIKDSTLSNNSAGRGGAIRSLNASYNLFTLNNTTISNNQAAQDGGGIAASGPVEITNSTISQNTATAASGGGIFLYSNQQATVRNTAIISNTAANGGGAYVEDSYVSFTNVTVSGNTATNNGGGIINYGGLALQNATISNNTATTNGGGIYGQADGIYKPGMGTVTLSNTLVAKNTAPTGPDLFGATGDIVSGGYNIFGTIADVALSQQTGDQTNVDPTISPLARSSLGGDGSPWVHAPLTDSPAVDKGSCPGSSVDQRGYTRPQDEITIIAATGGNHCDIGAFEVVIPIANDDTAATTSGASVEIDVLNNADGTDTHPDSLRTIDASSVMLVGPNGPTKGPVKTDKGTVTVNDSGTITYKPDNATVSGDDTFKYTVKDDRGWSSREATVVVELEYPCTTDALIKAIEAANAEPNRDTIFVADSCTYDLTTVYQYPASHYGDPNPPLPGGYTADQPSSNGNAGLPDIITPITIKTVDDNPVTIARKEGVSDSFRIFNVVGNGDLTLQNLTIQNGTSTAEGGNIYSTRPITLTGTTLISGTATKGGGIYQTGSSTLIQQLYIDRDPPNSDYQRRSTMTQNAATAGEGGALYNRSGTVSIDRTDITQNTATSNGGAIYNIGTTLSIDNTTMSNNRTTADNTLGGALYNSGGALTIDDTIINNNWTGAGTSKGGAIYDSNSDKLSITNSTIRSNGFDQDGTTQTRDGGAIYNIGGTVDIRNSTIGGNTTQGNRATESGGGIYNETGDLYIRDATLRNNGFDNAINGPVTNNGGAIYNTGGTITLYNWDVNVVSNNAKTNGGAIYNSGGNLIIQRGPYIQYNEAGDVGAAIYMTGDTLLFMDSAIIRRNTATNSGGGIYKSGGTFSSNEDHIYENTATNDSGGALYLQNVTSIITRTTLRNNTAPNTTNGQGGAVYNDGGTMTIDTATISDNEANQGGGFFNTGTLNLLNTTVTSNTATTGGGVQNTGTVEMFSSILAGNPVAGNNDCQGGTFTSNKYNLLNASCNPGADDQQPAANNDPLLGPLTDNGGGIYTRMAKFGSKALQMGSCRNRPESLPDTTQDQRNAPRPIAPRDVATGGYTQGTDYADDWCDIGAVEGILYIVNVNTDVIPSNTGDTDITLREAMENANKFDSEDVINFAIPGSNKTISTIDALPTVEVPVTINGLSEATTTCANDNAQSHTLPIVIDGAGAGDGVDGLAITAGDSSIRGIKIQNFNGDGIELNSGGTNEIRCTHLLNNGGHGINIVNSSNNRINYEWDADGGNYIRDNEGSGVYIASGTRNRIHRNDIYTNTLRGIDLAPAGNTLNDDSDSDSGANNLQNYPEMTSEPARNADGSFSQWETVGGELHSRPNTQYRIELFTNATCDESQWNGEGQSWRAAQNVWTDGNGVANFSFNYDNTWRSEGEPYVTLTATDNNQNTSEFSLCSLFTSSISGRAWNDSDRDGIRETGEAGLAGITVRLYTNRGRLVSTTTTASDGTYAFKYIANGYYYVRFDRGTYKISPKDAGDDATDSDADQTSGNTDEIAVPNGLAVANVDVGLKQTGATTTGSNGSKNPDTTLDITEDGTTDYYNVVLNSQPNANVGLTFGFDSSQIASISPSSWTFTPDNWDTPVKVTVTANDDTLVEDPIHTSAITNTFTSSDQDFAEEILVRAYITDNDSATVAVNPTELDVYIGGQAENFNMKLTRQPTADVVVSFDIDNDSADNPLVTPSPVTFTPSNWSTYIPVKVETATDASGESIRTVRFKLSSSDTRYDTGGEVITSTKVVVNLKDIPVRITPLDLTVTEGVVSEDNRYTVQLTEVPTSTITMVITPSSQITVDKTQITFTPDKLLDTIQVQAVDDAVPEPQHSGVIQHAIWSASGVSSYDGITLPDVNVTINDNDSPGVKLSTLNLSVAEEGSTRAEYKVSLTTKPNGNVTVRPIPDSQITVFPEEPLIFTPDTWDTEVVVTVEAVDDDIMEQNPHLGFIEHEVTATDSDPEYNKGKDPTLKIEVSVADNEVPNVQVDPTSVTVEEEGQTTATYNISLATNPDSDVVIELTPSATGQITITPATLTFKLADDEWKQAKTVTVQAWDDAAEEDKHWVNVSHKVTSGGNYAGVNIPDVQVEIYDNDTEGVFVEPSELIMVENGNAENYSVKLTKKPQDGTVVAVQIATDGKTKTDRTILTFKPDNDDWKNARIVKVLPIDDDIKQPGGQYISKITHTIVATTTDTAYQNLSADKVPGVEATVLDDESAGVSIEPVTMELTEGQPGQDYKVSLTRKPLNDVAINFKALDGQVTVNPSSWTFESSTWTTATNKLIRVTAINNTLADGNRTDTITHTTWSTDPSYAFGQFAIDNMEVNITDDESPNIVVTPEEIQVAEGSQQTYEVALTAKPKSDVVVSLTPSVVGQVTIRPSVITFTKEMTPQARIVTVEALDDAVVEGDHSLNIDHTAKATDPTDPYNNVVKQTIQVSIKEAGLILEPTEVSVSEGGTTAEYNVSINVAPKNDVVVTLAPDSQVKVIPSTLTFQAEGDSWQAPQTVRVEAIDDSAIEWKHTATVKHFFASDDPIYNDGGFPEELDVTIEDNDYPSVEITPLEVAVSEGEQSDPPIPNELTGTSDEYGVTLTYTPTAEVKVVITTDGESIAIPSTLTWTPSVTDTNWWKAQKKVTVYSTYDKVAEGLHESTLTHKTSCADCNDPQRPGEYNNLDDIYVKVQITDDDSPGVSITDADNLSVAEQGETQDTYNIVLSSEPSAEVTITFQPDEQVTVIPPFITFDSTNWDRVREVTVQAVDDDKGEAARHTGTIKHTISSADGNYDDASRQFAVSDVNVSVTDNEVAGVNITPTEIEVTENGATAEYKVSLSVPPTAGVSVTFDFKTGGLVQAIPPSLKWDYDPDNPNWWTAEKVVTIKALDNAIATGDINETISHKTISDDPRYQTDAFIIKDVTVSIKDDDKAGVAIVPTTINVSEDGNKDTYKVKLTSQPTEEVIVQISSVGGQVKAVPFKLTWTPDGTDDWWKTEKIVTVEAIDDSVAEGRHQGTLRHTVSSFDPQYAPNMFTIEDVQATIDDDDSAGVTINPTAIEVSEDGNTATYEINLNSEPTAEVRIDIAVADGQTTTKPPFVTFDSTNWDVKKKITVYATDDSIVEGLHNGTVKHTISSDDANYKPGMFVIKSVDVSIQDNDSPGVTINPTSVRVSEDGVIGEYEVKLNSEPTQDVVVTMVVGDGQVETIPPNLTFDATNWNVARKIKIQAIDDKIAEALHSSRIDHTVSSTDPNYKPDLFVIDPVDVTIEDNDAAGVTIDPTSVKVSEDGDTATYSIKLNSEPKAQVTVKILPNKQLTVKPPDKTFDATNWDVPQEITVSAVDDAIAEALHSGTITHTVSSDDDEYKPDMFAIADVKADIQDNDAPGVTVIVPEGFLTSEDGDTATYEVKLNSQPTADVIVQISNKDGQVSTAPMVMKFTATDWDSARQIIVSAVDDSIVEGLHSGTIRHNVSSDDENYKDTMFAIDDAKVEIKDNDSAGIRVIPTQVKIAEGGATAVYSITLTSQPSATVQLEPKPLDNQTKISWQPVAAVSTTARLNATTIDFDETNWQNGFLVTVEALDDKIFEETHYGSIGHTISNSSDANYQPKLFWIDQVRAEIQDNDAPGVIIAPAQINVAEGGSAATYTITLTTIPTKTVVVSMTVDNQVAVTPSSVVFEPPADASQAISLTKTILVQALDDTDTEGLHSTIIKHSISSEDPGYDGTRFDPDPVKVNIRDNDGAGYVVIQSPDGDTPDMTVTEGRDAKNYKIACTAAPSYTVNIKATSQDANKVALTDQVSGTAQLAANETFDVTFSPTDWTIPKDVPVVAPNNDIYEGVITRTITHQATSEDPSFNGTNVADMNVTIIDDEALQVSVYLPMVSSPGQTGIDLIGTFTIEPSQDSYTSSDAVVIVATIENAGQIALSDATFWVDFYINPTSPPTSPNTPWDTLSQKGVSWKLTNVSLAGGDKITVRSEVTDPYFVAASTDWDNTFPAGTTDLYLFVDVWDKNVDADQQDPKAAIPEVNEDNNVFHLTIPQVP